MNTPQIKVLAFDPSGNWQEGKGTTGYCVMVGGIPLKLGEIKASDYESPEAYWDAHLALIGDEFPAFVVVEGYKLYNHRGREAKIQSNSILETPQLIGCIRWYCYFEEFPLTIQYASDVKTRWNDDLLVRQGYLEQKGNRYYFNAELTSKHKRDALRHALHFATYKLKESK